MSRVTTLFLLLPCLDDEREAVDDSDDKLETPLPALRQYCKATNALRCLPMPVSKEAGGPKHIEARVYAWGANFLDLDEFLETVAKLPWDQPERVQVMFQEQDDEAFTLLDLGEARVWREAMVDRFQTAYGAEPPDAVLESLDGHVDRVDGDMAYVTLKSHDNGDVLRGQYLASDLLAKGIREHSRFLCQIVKVGQDKLIRLDLLPLPKLVVTDEEAQAIAKEMRETFPDDGSGAILY